VYLNGVLLVRNSDYTATNGTSITAFSPALAASDVVEVITYNPSNIQITDAVLETDITAKGDLFVGTAVDTTGILSVGANGRVLSANSETASGLEWVVADDANAIQNSIVDAKGDLIAATAADAVSRLAVGANATVLTADSAEATGMKWAAAAGGKVSNNKILNGDFFINQRAFTSNTADLSYNFDRFLQQVAGGGTTTVTPQVFTPGTAPVVGQEGRNFLQSITASQSGAGDYGFHSQRIEDVRTLANQALVVSFYAKANSGTPKIGIQLVQNFGAGGSPSAEVSTPISAITLTTDWARYEVTITCPSISGKTIGTNPNTSYLAINLWQSAGATFATQSSTTGIQNFTLQLWGIQVEAGTAATGFLTATGIIEGELAACQRYWYTLPNDTFGAAFCNAASQARVVFPFPVLMRAVPTSTLHESGGYYLYFGGSNAESTTTVGTIFNSTTSAAFGINVTGLTMGQGAVVRAVNALTTFSAEL
jgi:hypothetical protein